ncbi:MAG: phosphotransferase family protein [Xanthomonadales bacterium]|nr:phosphotransferase family protein [Gammaproteobacteria bacterium]MBT8054128.1 phosphotransferase family protein [Gammaproteobacteria bacterium]NND56121.1 phosphotransferase family protein [Xanthomonadales bacterium]NNK51652.1 phosphotransferase family protein [Xanthomonadales bacterium]
MNGRPADAVAAERALAGIPGFGHAQIEIQLSDGPTNASYRVAHEGRHFVLRLDKPGAASLGLNRHNEERVTRVVAAAGLALEPLYFDPEAGLYLRRFLPGRSWTGADLACPENLSRLARRLRTLHSLPPVGEAFDPLAAAERYDGQLASAESRSILERARLQAQAIGADSSPPVLCHNDLVCQNILESDDLMLIDWEYAAVGDPFFDLAVIVQHHDVAPAPAELLLRAYLQDSFSADAVTRLQRQCSFYQSLLQLWTLRVQP